MPTRATHRSQNGGKLYAERAKQGRFRWEDIQRVHGQDVERSSKDARAKKH
jgi:hypothetical protein